MKIFSNHSLKILANIVLVLVATAALAGAIYWFGYRPYKISKQCNKEARERFNSEYNFDKYEFQYQYCKREKL